MSDEDRTKIRDKCLILVICATGIASAFSGHALIGTLCLMLLVSIIYQVFRAKFDSLFVIGLMTCGWILISQTIYTFGQYISPIPPRGISILTYTLLFGCLSNSNIDLLQKKNIYRIVRFPIIMTATVALMFAQRLSTLVSFLGFGYDNYGHLNFFRTILISSKFWFGVINSTTPSDVYSVAPSGAHGALALFSAVTGINGVDVGDSTRIFAVATALLPIACFAVSIKVILRSGNSISRAVSGSFLIGGAILVGYPSHIWFSGFFASNTATLLLLIAVGVALSRASVGARCWLLVSLSATTFMTYSIYSICVAVVLLAVLVNESFDLLKSLKQLTKSIWFLVVLSISYQAILTGIALLGLRSANVTTRIISPGGIAPLPIGTTMFIFGLTAMMLIRPTRVSSQPRTISLIAQGLAVVAISLMVYGYHSTNIPGVLWAVPYYPTKLTIAIVIVVLVLLIDQFLPITRVTRRNFVEIGQPAFLVLGAVISLIYASYHSWPFSGSFLGSTVGVVESIAKNDPRYIEGSSIMEWVDASNKIDRPVLILMKDVDVELPTRWVNSLTLRWTTDTWGSWMSTNNAIVGGEFLKASNILSDNFLLITNQIQIIDSLQEADSSLEVCQTVLTLSGSCDIYYDAG